MLQVLQRRFIVDILKSGEGNLVVSDTASFSRRGKCLKLHEDLLAVEEDRLHGERGYSVDEVASMMRKTTKEIQVGE